MNPAPGPVHSRSTPSAPATTSAATCRTRCAAANAARASGGNRSPAPEGRTLLVDRSKRDTELPLHAADPPAHRRLDDAQPFRGPAGSTFLGHRHDGRTGDTSRTGTPHDAPIVRPEEPEHVPLPHGGGFRLPADGRRPTADG